MARKTPSALSPYVFMTDPQRVLDPVKAVRQIPIGATIIYRHFGKTGHADIAAALRRETFARDQQFLIGHDPDLAIEVGADGVHFRRDPNLHAPQIWRRRCADWLITMAGLKGAQNYTGDLAVLDAIFVSSIFYSKSPSAGDPIGSKALTQICRTVDVPIFALGGVNGRTAKDLIGTGAAGLAGIDGLWPQRDRVLTG